MRRTRNWLLKAFLIYHLTKLSWFITAPFIYWFGDNWLFMELWVLSQELTDVIGFYGVSIIFVLFIVALRNGYFQTLARIVFKKTSKFLNRLPLYIYFKSFFSSFKLVLLSLKNKIKK